jgi:PKD repeat protein
MKSTGLVGLALTLFMLLLVLGAAFLFLFQGRQGLRQRADTLSAEVEMLEQEVAETEADLIASESTRVAMAAELATAEANSVILEGELVESQQRTEELASELEEASSALTQLKLGNQQNLEQPPYVAIVSPEDSAVSAPGEPVEFIVVAIDAAGITAVNLTVNGETESYSVDDELIFTAKKSWTPPGAGSYTASAMAINSNGFASEATTITIEISDVEDQNAAVRSQVEANVAELRGLVPLEPIEPTPRTQQELRQRLQLEFVEGSDPAQARRDTLVLSAFDFLEPDFDLYGTLIELQGEGVMGFYDPETAEFVVVNDNVELNVAEQWTHAHEFMHALQDQHYQLDIIADEDLDPEARVAVRALAEGEAELIQFLYLAEGYFTDDQVTEIFAALNETETAFPEESPPILVTNLSFPYTAGFAFALELYRRDDDDFGLIDAAWRNLPQSTEQILHPDRYLSGDTPQLVSVPPLTETLGLGWEQLEEEVLGEFLLREYLTQQLSQEQVEVAATGWGGDRYAVYWNESEETLVMVLHVVWDTTADSAEFATLYPHYPTGLYEASGELRADGSECWQGDEVVCFYQDGQATIIVRAPDLETAAAVLAATP